MICVAAVSHKAPCISEMRFSATQRGESRFCRSEYDPAFRPHLAERMRPSASIAERKINPPIGLRNWNAWTRDLMGAVCCSRNAIGETQARLALTDAPQPETGNW
jgi:hypothetical protein